MDVVAAQAQVEKVAVQVEAVAGSSESPSASTCTRAVAASERQLNATDAPNHLDAVKIHFQDQPGVYNHLLDIMEDLKSQLCVPFGSSFHSY